MFCTQNTWLVVNVEQFKEQLSHSALSKLLDPVNAHQVCLTQPHGAHRYKVLKVDWPTPPRMWKPMIKKETNCYFCDSVLDTESQRYHHNRGPFQATVTLA